MPIFSKIRDFLFGSNKIAVFGGNKGGYSYLMFYDKLSNEVICQYVSPPKKEAKNTQVKASSTIGISGEVNYQSDISFADPFVVINKDRRANISQSEIISKIDEDRRSQNEPPLRSNNIHEIEAGKSFVTGPYVVPVAPANVENPDFQSHFDRLSKPTNDSLSIFLEFIIKTFWENRQTFRAGIFLYDAYAKELSMRVGYNMSQYPDYMIRFKECSLPVWESYKSRSIRTLDFNIRSKQDYSDVDFSNIWPELVSMIAVPIVDSDNTSLGVLVIDTDNNYVDAKFVQYRGNLLMLTRGIGRLLEGSSL